MTDKVETLPLNTYNIRTWGCQMNEADSQRLASELERLGLTHTEDADLADVTANPKIQSDHCPGYWWSEQMKYYYLIFANTPRVDYRKLYLSTEGNVLRGLRRT